MMQSNYLPSRMNYLISAAYKLEHDNELQINEIIENRPIKRKFNEKLDDNNNYKHIKLSQEVRENCNSDDEYNKEVESHHSNENYVSNFCSDCVELDAYF